MHGSCRQQVTGGINSSHSLEHVNLPIGLQQTPDVFEVLCMASARKEQHSNTQDLVDALWTMAKTRKQMSDVFEVLGIASARKEQDSNTQDLVNAFWTMAKTRMLMSDVFEVLCRASARKESDFNPQGLVNAFWTMVKTRTQMRLMSSRSHAGHQSGRSRTPTRKIFSMRFGPWRRLAC